MKYVIIIPDGAADLPLDVLDGRTPFEAAHTPRLDRLAKAGRLGTVATTPPGMPCGSDVCTMSLLGYDPRRYHTGRAPLEAAALGLDLSPDDWIFRVNLVTVIDGLMRDHSAGHISSDEGRKLITDFAAELDIPGLSLYPGVSYRNIMVLRSPESQVHSPKSGVRSPEPSDNGPWTLDYGRVTTTPPHDIPGEPIRQYLPHAAPEERSDEGAGPAELLQRIIAESEVFFAHHEINLTRREMGEMPVTHVWPWGQGRRPNMPSFQKRFGLRGAMITAVDLLAGLAHFIQWDRLDVPGQTSYHDTDYAAAGRHAVAALEDYDLVCVHIEAPDEASHTADAHTKVKAIEAIDQHVVGPIHDALGEPALAGGQMTGGERRVAHPSSLTPHPSAWRMLVLPDHYTRVDNRKHDPTPVPFLMAGTGVRAAVERTFTERCANEADLHIPRGHELMEYFLRSGLR